MARSGLRLGRPFGVELIADFSLLLVVSLVAVNLALGILPHWHPDWSGALRWGLAVVASLMFVASIALHELGHALVARHHGLAVRRITLFLFGGMAQLEREPDSARTEFWMAIVGPLISLTIGFGSLWLASLLLPNPTELGVDPQRALEQAPPLVTLLAWLGPLNLAVGVFNLVPGFPLDGGRVLRSVLWWASGDLRKATLVASRAGQTFAWLLMGMGVFMMLGQHIPLFGSGFIAGLWLIVIGWFLNNAARMSFQQLMIRQALEDIPLRDVMRSDVVSVPPDLSIAELVRSYLVGTDQPAFPVVNDGVLLGLVQPDQVGEVPRERWSEVKVSEVMIPARRLHVMSPEDDAMEALQHLAEQDPIPVVDRHHLVGVARRADLMRCLAWYQPRRA